MESTMSGPYVYLAKAGRGYKIGYTMNTTKRFKRMQAENHSQVHIIRLWITDAPRKLERYLHRRYASSRRGGEWFSLSRDQLVDALQLPDAPNITEEVKQMDLRHTPGQRQVRRKRKPAHCQRCGHVWTPYGTAKPRRCANVHCRSPVWDTPVRFPQKVSHAAQERRQQRASA
jgi:predicted Zn-ribbon and HTH transcriptional regulator